MPVTDNGRLFVDLAHGHVAGLQTSAALHDAQGSFPYDSFTALRNSGVLGACVPKEFGGLGVTSVNDFVTGVNRLGRGDGSVALGANMHMSQAWLLANYWSMTMSNGNVEAAGQLAEFLRKTTTGGVLMASAVAEIGTDVLHPYTELTKQDDTWRINGRKMFATLVPVAEVLHVPCSFTDKHGARHFAVATVPVDADGVTVNQNWDALGMKASGSHSVEFDNTPLSAYAVALLGPWGTWTEAYLLGEVVITLGLVAAFLGIAESARELILAALKTPRKSGRSPSDRFSIQHLVAEMEIDLAASRAMVTTTARHTDDFLIDYAMGVTPIGELHQLMKDFQCTKTFVNRKAIDIVDKALTASGGAGYMSVNPLSRLYRDVRAGPFMQPYSPNEAYEYIGRVVLGLDPHLADYE